MHYGSRSYVDVLLIVPFHTVQGHTWGTLISKEVRWIKGVVWVLKRTRFWALDIVSQPNFPYHHPTRERESEAGAIYFIYSRIYTNSRVLFVTIRLEREPHPDIIIR